MMCKECHLYYLPCKIYNKTTAGTFSNKIGYQAPNRFMHACLLTSSLLSILSFGSIYMSN